MVGDAVYIRTVDGETFHTDVISGLRQFFSDQGYRITFTVDGVDVVLRRGLHDLEYLRVLDGMSAKCTAAVIFPDREL